MNKLCIGLILSLWGLTARAGVEISDAWARTTAPGQEVGAVYMTLVSSEDATLVAASTPVADSVEIHRMWMDNGVMKMRMLDTLKLPAGKQVRLEPGGFHLMLFDLRKTLEAGEKIGLNLAIKDKRGKQSTQYIELPVKAD